MSRMFPFITKTSNPVGGECKVNCPYCWAKKLIKRHDMEKYQGRPRLYFKELEKKFNEKDFVFVSDMRDLFEPNVPSFMIQQVLDHIYHSPATFLLLTKCPMRYHDFEIPRNCVCGATIETDLGFREDRILSMQTLNHPRKMVAIEPIMKFSPNFLRKLLPIQPEFVAIGYDNYNCGLEEPSLEVTKILIGGLEAYGIKVYTKTLREAEEKASGENQQ